MVPSGVYGAPRGTQRGREVVLQRVPAVIWTEGRQEGQGGEREGRLMRCDEELDISENRSPCALRSLEWSIHSTLMDLERGKSDRRPALAAVSCQDARASSKLPENYTSNFATSILSSATQHLFINNIPGRPSDWTPPDLTMS